MRRLLLLLILLAIFVLGPVVAVLAAHPDGARATCHPVALGGNAMIFLHLGAAQTDDELVSAASSAADRIALHRMGGGVGGMAEQHGFATPRGRASDLTGRQHLMLLGSHNDLKAGDRFLVNLTFAHAPSMLLLVRVVAGRDG